MIRNIAASGILLVVACLAGCKVTSKDNATFGFRWGTDVAFYHETSETKASAESEIQSQPLLDWINKQNAPPEPEAEPAPNP